MSSSTGTVVFNDSRIKATGVIATESIGVGTANPTSNLHVVGDASIQSNLEVGTANLFVDTTTGNVGVGTTSPNDKLHVNGHIRVASNKALTLISTDTLTYDGDSMPNYGVLWRTHTAYTGGPTMQMSGYGGIRMFTQANERVTILNNGNVGIGTVTPAAKLHVNGSIYSPGHPVQYVADNVHNIVTYAATTGGRYVTPLDVTITPKFSNSNIFVQWVINFEAHQDMVFRVYRGSTLIGYNTSIANNRWNGVSTADYDQNQSSTPGQSTISWIDSPNTTSAVTYRVYVQSSSTGSYPFYLNRTYGSSDTGQDAYERMVSYKSATEIAV